MGGWEQPCLASPRGETFFFPLWYKECSLSLPRGPRPSFLKKQRRRGGAGWAEHSGREPLPPELFWPPPDPWRLGTQRRQLGRTPPLTRGSSGASCPPPPLARAHLVLPLAGTSRAALDRGPALGVTQGTKPHLSSRELTQVFSTSSGAQTLVPLRLTAWDTFPISRHLAPERRGPCVHPPASRRSQGCGHPVFPSPGLMSKRQTPARSAGLLTPEAPLYHLGQISLQGT